MKPSIRLLDRRPASQENRESIGVSHRRGWDTTLVGQQILGCALPTFDLATRLGKLALKGLPLAELAPSWVSGIVQWHGDGQCLSG